MTRLVTHEDRSPLRIDVEDLDEEYGNIAICRCGLAASYPFCDGSHRATEDEDEGILYRYTDDGDESDESDESNEGGESGGSSANGGRSRRIVERIVDAEE